MRVPVPSAAVAAIVIVTLFAAGVSCEIFPKHVFSKSELEFCTRIRTPNIMQSASGSIHVVVRCCGKNRCSSRSPLLGEAPPLGDNNKDGQVVMKTSLDGGLSWGDFQVLSPAGQKGFSNGGGIYDKIRDRLVVQYQFVPGGSTEPIKNASYYQIVSSDDGASWSDPVEITAQLAPCNPDQNQMMSISAGNKVQSPSGRLLWAGHNHHKQVCLWYSDDGGETYKTTDLFRGSEVSVSFNENNQVIMNGRGQNFDWFPHRASYISRTDGATWDPPTESVLLEDGKKACERSLVNINGTLFSSEPTGKHRSKMRVECSRDGGQTWPYGQFFDGDAEGGYSDITDLDNGDILLVWEDGKTDNILSFQMGTEWCG